MNICLFLTFWGKNQNPLWYLHLSEKKNLKESNYLKIRFDLMKKYFFVIS